MLAQIIFYLKLLERQLDNIISFNKLAFIDK